MEHRWQVLNQAGGADEWIDAEPPVDAKVLDLAAQIIELEQRVKFEEDEAGEFMDKAWKATGVDGNYPYPGVILMEIAGQAKERQALMVALEEIADSTNWGSKEEWVDIDAMQEIARKVLEKVKAGKV